MTDEVRIPIRSDGDIVTARQMGREMATKIGFSGTDLTVIATAISEVVRNIVVYAGSGELLLAPAQYGAKQGLLIEARDQGPGIADIDLAMMDGYSTGGSLGLGLPGAKRLMDEFDLTSAVGQGTTVTMKKWKP
ncbi:MAG TPA: anti-sigma regulatory factor [Rhodocyclaceae bacterium]|nr:anti-sigma regulatory factor [Rhodocyclaceae bacterium]